MTAGAILEAREERASMQQALLMEYNKPLLLLRVNTPGPEKNLPVAQRIFDALEAELNHRFVDGVLLQHLMTTAEGPMSMRILDMPVKVLKTLAVALEDEHPLGRFVDLDVYSPTGESLSRTELGCPVRACYVCSAPAHGCARARTHALADLLAVMEKAVNSYTQR